MDISIARSGREWGRGRGSVKEVQPRLSIQYYNWLRLKSFECVKTKEKRLTGESWEMVWLTGKECSTCPRRLTDAWA